MFDVWWLMLWSSSIIHGSMGLVLTVTEFRDLGGKGRGERREEKTETTPG
jgi:hypothetical protein